jgi:hypothetical protein
MESDWVAHKTERLYWFRHVVPYVQFEVALSVFVSLVIGVADCSDALECKGLDPDRRGGPYPSLYSSGVSYSRSDRLTDVFSSLLCGKHNKMIQFYRLDMTVLDILERLDLQTCQCARHVWASFLVVFGPVGRCRSDVQVVRYLRPIYPTQGKRGTRKGYYQGCSS